MDKELSQLMGDFQRIYDAALQGWMNGLKLRDPETKSHSDRVAALATQLGTQMGLTEDQLTHLRRGALLHDIGKMGTPDAILFKPGPLTTEERQVMQQHPQFGNQFLHSIAYLQPAAEIVYCHHEHWDGSGYPRGLKGEEIPLSARIFSVVDVWDALTSDRPYRASWSREKTMEYIQGLSGIQFDPKVVDIFTRLMKGVSLQP